LKGHISSGGCKFGPIIGGTSILYNDRGIGSAGAPGVKFNPIAGLQLRYTSWITFHSCL